MGRENIDAVLQDLGERLGMPGLRLDEAGACQLLFDQRWLVTLVHVPPLASLGLHCPVTGAGEADRLPAASLLAMLKASFQGQGAGGATLCIGPGQRAYLQRVMQLPEPGAARVQQALEQLLNFAETWAERLSRPESATRPVAAPPGPGEWAMQRV